MPQIGEFTRDETGFIGNFATLFLQQDIIIVQADHVQPAPRQPDRDLALSAGDVQRCADGREFGCVRGE